MMQFIDICECLFKAGVFEEMVECSVSLGTLTNDNNSHFIADKIMLWNVG